MVFKEIINNITLLVTVLLLFSFIYERFYKSEKRRQIFFGIVFGFAVVIGMNNALTLSDGVFFDIRSAVLGVAALFGGPITALIATAIAAAARIYMGGVGMLMGTMTIITSSLFGLAAYYWFHRKKEDPGSVFLYFFGLVVNLSVLAWVWLLPEGIRDKVVASMTGPIVTLYPLATVMVGWMMIAIRQNIGSRKQAELNEQRLRLAMETSSDGLWEYIDRDHVYFSPNWKRMLGYDDKELPNAPDTWYRHIHDEDIDRVKAGVQAFRENPDGLYQQVFRMKHKDGSDVYVLSKGGAIKDEQGRVERYIGTHTDITELRRTQKKLEELNATLEERVQAATESSRQKELLLLNQSKLAAMGEMLVAISHHWRQPLTVVSLMLQEIEEAHEAGELSAELLHELTQSGLGQIETMSTTIDEFRFFFESSQQPEPFDLLRSIKEVGHIVGAEYRERSIELRIEGDEKLRIMGVPGQLRQALLNILGNAKDAISERKIRSGLVDIRVDRLPGKVRLRITDNGGGVAADKLESIFNPYFTTKEQGRGVGLGLYMSKVVVEKYHQGTITAYNHGDGLTVEIELPDMQSQSKELK